MKDPIPFDKWVVEVTNHELHELPTRLHGYLHTAWATGVPIVDAREHHAEEKRRDRNQSPMDKQEAPPNPYSQGFRDALLTVKARLIALADDPDEESALAHLKRNLNALIDRANQDLWALFAVAQVDLSAHSAYPEAEALRAMLRAPTGVLIDSAGRMLFVRLNGTDYYTGVLALLEEVARLKAAAELAPPPELMSIIINGISFRVERGKPLTFENLIDLTGRSGSSISYQGVGALGEFEGTLTSGGSLVVPPDTVFKIA